MKKLILTLILFSLASMASTENKRGFLINSNFEFKSSKKSFHVKYDSIFAEDNNNWTPMGPPKSGVVLLGKLQLKEKGILQMEYMVLDTEATPVALNQMSIISQLNNPSSISTDSGKNKISVGFLAKPTTYSENK